jgi:two-component system sensor histidine kinase AgrC
LIIDRINGELSISGGEPATTKEDKEIHGFGMRIIKETVEGLGGLVIMDPDQEKRIFKIRICIPRSSSRDVTLSRTGNL